MGILDWFTGSARDRFAGEALRIARRSPDLTAARYDRELFAIVVERAGDSKPAWVYLTNVYGECRGVPRAERRERIERLLRIMAAPREEETWDSGRSKLRPVLRPATFGQGGVPGSVPPISRPALPYLRELVVIDLPESMAYVGPAHVEQWGVTVDEVFDAARANIDDIASNSLESVPASHNALIRMIDDTGDGYLTSLPLARGWLAEVSARMGRPVIAFVPATNTVVLRAVPLAGGLGNLYELVEKEYTEAVRGLSPVGYVANECGAIVPYAPPDGHPDHVASQRAQTILAAAEYAAQTQWLADQYQRAGIDVFVARLMVAARTGEPPITVATWGDGITSLLPEAQHIVFARDGAVGPRVPWHAVAELVDLQPEPLLTPPRYRVENWPTPDVMDMLRARAVD